ncbi:MAG: MCE family protein [candidate division Zixibacteria bacterium]|nr:MCE family protein [candidate division Zixibacteria bacterium]
MKRSGKIKFGNLWVGIIATCAMAALLYTSFHGGGTSIFETKSELYAYFKNVNGLVKGAPVWLGGIEVGNVKSVQFVNLDENRRIKAVLTIKNSVWEFITENSRVQLGTIGLLGDKYVEVVPGSKGLPVMEKDSEIMVLQQVGLDAMASKAPKMIDSVDSLLTSMKEITSKIASGEGTAGKLVNDTMLYKNLVDALKSTTVLMSSIQKDQKKIMDKLASTMDNTDKITAQIASGEGSAGKLVYDEKMYDNLTNSSGHIGSILAKIDSGDGSAGALVNDAELYEEVRNLVVRINNLVADIEKNPRKYFKFSVF